MNEESCSDYFVSSYCPAFNSIPSTRGFRRTSTDRPKVLLVTASHAPDLPPLPNAQEEARLIQNLLPSCAHASLQQTSGLQETISSLSTASILHLACHGRQDRLNPLQSGFHLADGKLTIARIMEQNNPDALFAFLSACETAKGDDARPDQLIHLANAMIFAGFKSVIATMWYVHAFHDTFLQYADDAFQGDG
jgi:CHAT domain-containing protein